MNLRFYEKVLEWTRAGKRVAAVTIVSTVGSTPRKPGAKMLVSSELDLYGTIGGGCVEADVIFAAQEVLKTLVPRLVTVDIKAKSAAELDMLCGGEITLYVEPVMPDFKLLVCGGGHISHAIVHVAQNLDFRIAVVDDREAFANTKRFPGAEATIAGAYEKLGELYDVTSHTFAIIVTRGHTGDEACLHHLLKSPACFIAMIGSRAKWANIRKRLREAGFRKADLDRVHSPAGIDIGSVTPEEIAVSVVAQAIQARAGMLADGFPSYGEPKKKTVKGRDRPARKSSK